MATFRQPKKRDYLKKEIQIEKKLHHGHIPIKEYYRLGTRRIYHIPEQEHKKGVYIEYKEKVFIVQRATNEGIWAIPLKNPDKPHTEPFSIGKPEFISDKELETKAFPYYYAPQFMPVI